MFKKWLKNKKNYNIIFDVIFIKKYWIKKLNFIFFYNLFFLNIFLGESSENKWRISENSK
jgi:hypothetical protein